MHALPSEKARAGSRMVREWDGQVHHAEMLDGGACPNTAPCVPKQSLPPRTSVKYKGLNLPVISRGRKASMNSIKLSTGQISLMLAIMIVSIGTRASRQRESGIWAVDVGARRVMFGHGNFLAKTYRTKEKLPQSFGAASAENDSGNHGFAHAAAIIATKP